jgi:hypothetical protein
VIVLTRAAVACRTRRAIITELVLTLDQKRRVSPLSYAGLATFCTRPSANEARTERKEEAMRIFYSWQADHANGVGRSFIENALRTAIEELKGDATLDEAVRNRVELDKDTQGTPGTPPIVDTILKKIEGAVVYVPDLTFVSCRPDGRPVSNPNVLIEYGWALKALGHSRMMPIFNEAYGEVSAASLPFDMAHLRHGIKYNLADGADDEMRKRTREGLTRSIKMALRSILDSDELKALLPKAPPFVPLPPILRRARFRADDEPIGDLFNRISRTSDKPSPVRLAAGPAMWVRAWPVGEIDGEFNAMEVQRAIYQDQFRPYPLNWHHAEILHLIADDGMGTCAPTGNGISAAAFHLFKRGEAWSVDTMILDSDSQRAFMNEENFAQALSDCVRVLNALSIPGPFKWQAGIEGIKGRTLSVVGHQPSDYPFRTDQIVAESEFTPGKEPLANVLDPFFKKVFGEALMQR